MNSIRAIALALLAACNATSALAAEAFDAAKFAQAQAAGKTVLLEFYAPWCTVCVRQKESLRALESSRAGLTVFQVDFDGDSVTTAAFKVATQSTLIAFQGTVEKGRLVGRSKQSDIEAFLTQVLKP
jgi:thioredoxin 1